MRVSGSSTQVLLERENMSSSSALPLDGRRCSNRCIIFPSNVCMVAESVEKRYHTWYVRNNFANDLIIKVGETSFHLHKLPMVSRSGYINRLVFQEKHRGTNIANIQIDNLPGGSKMFELVVNFCYGMKVELTAANISPLYCAANFLEMSDDFEQENLISKTDTFLSFLVFSSWKDTFQIFKSCESISMWAREFGVLSRCVEAVAWKVSMDVNEYTFWENEVQCFNFLAEKRNNSDRKKVHVNWWFKDLSYLRIDHFTEVITTIKRKGIKPELVGSCIAHWTTKWLFRIPLEFNNAAQKRLTIQLHRITIESLINLIPQEEKSISFNFLLHLLKVGRILKVEVELLRKLERRLGLLLESVRVKDLIVKNCGNGESEYDVGIVVKVVEAYGNFFGNESSSSKICVVGRLVDEYLALVARDKNVEVNVFKLLVEALPKDSRYCHDNLYRAIDMYLKVHSSLTEEERSGLCRTMEYHKLSQEARKHVVKNDRLPLNITTRFILLEQVNMARSFTDDGSNYHRTKSQAITRVSKNLSKGWVKTHKDLKMMTRDVETIKVQLCELQLCKIGLQRRVKCGLI